MGTNGSLDHCQGTLVVHVEGGLAVECTDQECVELDQLRHTLVVDCTALSGGCVCTVLDDTVLDETVLDDTVLDDTVLDDTVLEESSAFARAS
jgi:hypothetical protein